MMREPRINERPEVRLDRVQVLWLTLGGLMALGLMFALGVVVGRRAAILEEPPPLDDPIATLDATGEMHEKLRFYDELTEPAKAQTKAPAVPKTPDSGEPPTPPEEPAVDPDASTRAALARGPAKRGEYTIQVSAYQSMAEARAHAAALERKGFKTFIVTSTIKGRGTWYRVRLGRFSNEAEAARGKLLLASADIPAWVLKTE